MHRYALVSAGPGSSKETIERYLPENYRIISTGVTDHLVAGVDDSGWTLDDYVLPRLVSGLHFGREVKGTQLVVAHSECAMHCQVAGLECHVIEEDRYHNGTEIPEEKRDGCFVIATTPRMGGQRIPMLKAEAGWRD